MGCTLARIIRCRTESEAHNHPRIGPADGFQGGHQCHPPESGLSDNQERADSSRDSLHENVVHFAMSTAAGEVLLYTGPLTAGATYGAVSNLTRQGLKNLTGKQCGFDVNSLAFDTAVGTATGFIPGMKIPGVTAGRNSLVSIANQIATKASNGTTAVQLRTM